MLCYCLRMNASWPKARYFVSFCVIFSFCATVELQTRFFFCLVLNGRHKEHEKKMAKKK